MEKWTINLGGEYNHQFEFSGPLSPGLNHKVKLDGKSIQIRWEPLLRTIFVQQIGSSVLTPIRVSSSRINHLAEELVAEVSLRIQSRPTIAGKARVSTIGGEGLFRRKLQAKKGADLKSPMTGKVIKVFFKTGSTVQKGDVVTIIEAMKMENNVCAPISGTLGELNFTDSDRVQAGQILATIKPVTSEE